MYLYIQLLVTLLFLHGIIASNIVQFNQKEAPSVESFFRKQEVGDSKGDEQIQLRPEYRSGPPTVWLDYPFRNTSLPWNDRVDDLVKRLSLTELVNMTISGGQDNQPSSAIPRLQIRPYNFNTECLRGIVTTNSTAFAQSLGLAATFDTKLMVDIASVIGQEARALHINAVAHGVYKDQTALSCFAPVSNIMRHPLWGRNAETYGEDPYLVSKISVAYVRGLQGDHPRYVQANAGCKAFALYSGPENINGSRFGFNAIVGERDLRLTYLPAFKACVQGGSMNIMCSYSSVNGVPSCGSKKLLVDILRKEYGFTGYVVSDEGAIEFMYNPKRYVNSTIAAAVLSAKMQLNLELPFGKPTDAYPMLGTAVEQGLLSFDQLMDNVRPMFYTRMRLGEFDPPEGNPYSSVPMSVVQNKTNRDLAITAAIKSLVLLKNSNNTLPLTKKIYKKIAVVGPMADNLVQLYGGYSAAPQPQFASTPYGGLKDLGLVSTKAAGCNDNHCLKYDNTSVIEAVSGADVVFVCLGTGKDVEGESSDRRDMQWPGYQLQLLKDAVSNATSTSKIILLVFTGGPIDISWAVSSDRVGAIYQCTLPAQATGAALRSVMAPDQQANQPVSPAGRLPYTWYMSLTQVPQITNYSMYERTYRYFSGTPLFPFGYGLSYTQFVYANLKLISTTVKAGEPVTVGANITNIGPYDSDEVVQVYINWPDSPELMPRIQLVAFDRVHIKAKSSANISLTIEADQLQIWSETNGFFYHPGTINIWLGGQQPDQQVKVPSNVLSGKIQLVN